MGTYWGLDLLGLTRPIGVNSQKRVMASSVTKGGGLWGMTRFLTKIGYAFKMAKK